MRALALVALFSAGTALAAAAPSPEATARKEQADARRDAGDATGALAAYREALEISPGYVEVWEEVGKLYFGAKKFSEAAEAFQHAVEVDGSYANNWFNLALARRRAGELDRARDAFRRYLVLKPDDADARMRLADVLRALDDREGAMKEYQAVSAAADARNVEPGLGDRARDAIGQLRALGGAPAAAARPPTIVAVPAAEPAPASAARPAPVITIVQTPGPVSAAPPASLPTNAVAQPVQPVLPPAPAAARPEPPAPPSPALLDKLALGDKLQASGDYRGALFAYQDAVYLEPRNAVARVKLGRSYWILRYVGQADEQWQQATQLAPTDPSIAYMIEEARKAPRPAVATQEPAAGAAAGGATVGGTGAARAQGEGPRVYKFVPEGMGQGAEPQPYGGAPAAPQQREQVAATTPGYGMPQPQPQPPAGTQQGYSQPSGYAPPQQGYAQPAAQPPPPQQPLYPPPPYEQRQYQPQPQYAQPAYAQPQPGYGQPAPGSETAPPQPPSASATAAAQRYRAAISLYVQRDYLGAIAELDAAITLDPNLAVAYTARGSSKFGLRRYREAAGDYKAALDLDPTKAEPIWGLAECQRMQRDPAAPDTYRRYAASISGDVNEERRARARKWATELSSQPPQ